MKTRIFSLLIILALTGSVTFAQKSDNAKMSFGIIGGVNLQNLNGKNAGGDKLTNKMITGFHAGLNVQIPVAPQFYFQPGLMFATKGAKYTSGSLTQTTKLNYIELPLNLVYKAQLGGGFFMLGFGPYIGYAIGGKFNTVDGSVSNKSDVRFQNTVEVGESHDPTITYFKKLDAGGNIFAGFEMASGIFLQLDTQLGMLNIKPVDNRLLDTSDKSNKNTGFGFSLGYRF